MLSAYGLISGFIIEMLIEISLLLVWLGGWNLLCIVLSDDSPESCILLILVGLLLRAILYSTAEEKSDPKRRLIVFVRGSRKAKSRKKRYMPLRSQE